MELEEGIHCVEASIGGFKPLNQYLILGDDMLWIDAGIASTPDDFVFSYLQRAVPEFENLRHRIVITHADVDHFGGLRNIRKRLPNVTSFAHHLDIPWIQSPVAILHERYMMHRKEGFIIPQEQQDTLMQRGGGGDLVDLPVKNGDVFETGRGGSWQVLHAPGHTPGHIVLWENKRKLAIIGDAALGLGVPDTQGNLIAPPPYFDVKAYRSTIKMLSSLEANRTFTCHYGVLDRQETQAFYEESLEAVSAIESAVDQIREKHGQRLPLKALCTAVGKATPYWDASIWDRLADPVSAHLASA